MSSGGCLMNSKDANPVVYLTASDIYNINDAVTEGHTFVRDINLLNSAVARPKLVLFGEVQFPTLIDKAASLMHSLAYHHLFADGNKRTALYAVILFLEKNGLQLNWETSYQYDLLLAIAQGKYDVAEIAARIAPYIEPLDPSE